MSALTPEQKQEVLELINQEINPWKLIGVADAALRTAAATMDDRPEGGEATTRETLCHEADKLSSVSPVWAAIIEHLPRVLKRHYDIS